METSLKLSAEPPQNAVHDRPVIADGRLLPALGWQEVFQQSPFRFAQIASTKNPSLQGGPLNQDSISPVNHFVNRGSSVFGGGLSVSADVDKSK